jgi:hypothetical protein
MYVAHQYGIVMAAITTAVSGAKRITWSDKSIWLYVLIINLVTEIISQVYFVYKFPLLFVSYVVVTDPLFQTIMTKNIYKMYKKYLIKITSNN